MTEGTFFSTKQSAQLHALKGRAISNVYYHYWHNTESTQQLTFLYALELHFSDGDKLMISTGDSDSEPELRLNELDLAQEKADLKSVFGDRLQILSTLENENPVWEEALLEEIENIHLAFDKTKQLNHSTHLVFAFSDIRILIKLAEQGDGLQVEEIDLDQYD